MSHPIRVGARAIRWASLARPMFTRAGRFTRIMAPSPKAVQDRAGSALRVVCMKGYIFSVTFIIHMVAFGEYRYIPQSTLRHAALTRSVSESWRHKARKDSGVMLCGPSGRRGDRSSEREGKISHPAVSLHTVSATRERQRSRRGLVAIRTL